MHIESLQVEAVMFLRAYMILTDAEWVAIFSANPSSQSYTMAMWNRIRSMSENKNPASPQVALSHKALCLNCGTVYDRWPNEHGVDLLRGCFEKSCFGYADTHWEATLLGRIMLYG